MPMWISWLERRKIYNYCDPETPEGQLAIRVAKKSLAEKLDVPSDQIPGFKVEVAPWPGWLEESTQGD